LNYFAARKLFAIVVLLAGLLWSYWPILERLEESWSLDPQYSHGYLVPIIAVVVLWNRRDRFGYDNVQPPWQLIGLALIVLGSLLRLLGMYLFFFWMEAVSLLPYLLGLSLILGGRQALSWVWPAVLYLLFMIPLPYKIGSILGQNLQRVATITSTYVLETLGYPAIAEGNVITVRHSSIGIVEACSGLRMLMILLALATAMAVLKADKGWQKVLLLGSALPVAIFVNVVRISMTGILQETLRSTVVNNIHDLLGWVMMPVALLLLWAEAKMTSDLLVHKAPGLN
jgi:exosortase